MTIGEYLKQKRKDKKLSLRQVAYKVNLSHSNISDIERGEVKKEESILKIIAALNLTKAEKEEALKLLVEGNTPDDLKNEVLEMKKGLIINSNNHHGDIIFGNNKKVYINSAHDELNLEGLNDAEIQLVKNYIDFLKTQKIIKKED